MGSPRLDVAVVGAGVVGLAIAREFAGRGARVAVFERAGIGAGASGVQPGGVRQQWGTPIACRMARESAAFYADADERLAARVPLGFRRCGYLFLAHGEETLQRLAANVAVQHAEGVAVADRVAGGSRRARSRARDRHRRRRRMVRGGRVLRPAAGRGRGLRTAGSTCESARCARCRSSRRARSWSPPAPTRPRFCPGLPIEREDRWLFYSDPIAERLLDPLVVSPERRFAAKQLGDGRVLASDLGARGDDAQSAAWRANVRAGIEELLPVLTYVSFRLLVRGEYDVTPDHQPLLGEVEKGVYVAAGFSGHGFMIAPAVARILADAILDGKLDEALTVLDPARFVENRPVPEPQLV